MKNVLVLMHDDAGQEARFQAALDLTRALDGHLSCIDVAAVPAFVGDYAEIGGTALLMNEEQQREQANRTRMVARLGAEDVPYDWIDETGFLVPCVHDAAAMADVVVLNRELDGVHYPDMVELAGEILLKARKPVVAVPGAATGFDAFGEALIAWDGSGEAEAALRAAVPLLVHAARVTIIEVNDGSLKSPAVEAAEYLSRHGIKPIIRHQGSMVELPSSLILDTIRETRAHYLVMGAFGHSRLVEATLGGVTRRMLTECPVPLFLAH